MKTKILLILMGSILALQCCATNIQTIKVTPIASPEQKIANINGKEFITSQKKYIVSLSPYSLPDIARDKTMFQLLVQNRGDEPIRIGYENVSMTFQENTKEGASNRINIQSFDDFMKDFSAETKKNESEWYKSALMDVKDLRQGEVDDIKDKYGQDDPNDKTIQMRKQADIDKLEAKIRVDGRDLDDRLARRRAKDIQLRNELIELVMKPQTIMPGGDKLSLVVGDTRNLDKNAEGKFQVIISVDGEEHGFTFNRSLDIKKR